MGTLIKRTSRVRVSDGAGNWTQLPGAQGIAHGGPGGSYTYAAHAYWNPSAGNGWAVTTMIQSAPDVTLSGGGAATGSGASSSGSASKSATATPGGTHSGNLSYSWSRLSGDSSITPDNAASSAPTWSRSFSGVANGTTSSGVSADWRCTVTDNQTGAVVIADITIGPLAWQNTIPAFSGRTDFIRSSQSVATPAGANTLVAYIIGGSKQGGSGYNDGMGTEYYGGGASGAGQCVKTVSGPSGNYSCTVGAGGYGAGQGGTSSVTGNGISASASGGYGGDNAGPGGAGADQNSVGTCSGGDSHYNGNPGVNGYQAGGGGLAGANGGPYDGEYWGYGGNGGTPFAGGDPGKDGFIMLVWSP